MNASGIYKASTCWNKTQQHLTKMVNTLGLAAATTAFSALGEGVPEEPVEVTIDRPFVFLIRDIETDSILLIGRVLNPRT